MYKRQPEIMELINKYIPAVLEHPLLEVGRSFIFNDALPYIEDMVTEEDVYKRQGSSWPTASARGSPSRS